MSLCVSPNEDRDPLGVIANQTWVRTEQVKHMRQRMGKNENSKWYEGVELSEKRLGPKVECIHVMDREGDSYELYDQLIKSGRRFIIRGFYNRNTLDKEKSLDTVDHTSVRVKRKIYISARKKSPLPYARKMYPERNSRIATLNIRATSVQLKRSEYNRKKTNIAKACTINIVSATEVNCPKDNQSICWYLITNESIDAPEDILAIVDAYRSRWVIEEYFKALKTGCQYEQLQFGSYEALLRALAIYIPVAFILFRLRYLAGIQSKLSANRIFNPIQLKLIRTFTKESLPNDITVRQALLLVAKKGGHVKNNGDPGWLVLSRGLHDLLLMEQGVQAFMNLNICDQS